MACRFYRHASCVSTVQACLGARRLSLRLRPARPRRRVARRTRIPKYVRMGKDREDARRCDRCAYQWYAVRTALPQRPRWYDETGAFWTDANARMKRLQGNYDRAKVQYDRWAICPRCGSVKVRTVKARGFLPTAAAAHHTHGDGRGIGEPHPAMSPPNRPTPAPGWYRDPYGATAPRWWDGHQWTELQQTDLVHGPPGTASAPGSGSAPLAAGWYPDTELRGGWRYWNGTGWTDNRAP